METQGPQGSQMLNSLKSQDNNQGNIFFLFRNGMPVHGNAPYDIIDRRTVKITIE